MHISPGVIEGPKMILGYVTGAGSLLTAAFMARQTIAEDGGVKLPGATERTRRLDDFQLPQKIMAPRYGDRLDAMMPGGLKDLRAKGVTHVVVYADGAAIRAMRESAGPWAELQRDGRLLWQCRGGTPSELQPPLELFSIARKGP